MKLSSSSLKLFKACRRAYELRKVYNVVPVDTQSEALQIGTNYHAMIEELHKNQALPALDSKEAAMVHAYAKYILPEMPEFEPEIEFECICGSKDNVLTGRIDGRVCSENAIVEHKTTSLDVEEFEFNLQWDEQLLTYFWATGCNTAYYTVCKKPTIRQKQSETPEEFAQRCLDWYSEDTDSKIRLLKIVCTPEDIKAHKKQLWKMFTEIKHAQKHNNFYRNPCYCNSWGRPCEYKPICLNYNPDEEYVGFERRDN